MSTDQQQILEALRPVVEPHLGRNIIELNIVRNVENKRGRIRLDLRLPTPFGGDELRGACEAALGKLEGVKEVTVNCLTEVASPPLGQRKVLPGVKNLVAVASGKGGVAKSTTAVNLALCLQRAGARVGILDADIYGPSLTTMLAVDQEPTMGPDQRLFPAEAAGLKLISMGFFVPDGKAAVLRGPMVSGYISQFLANVDWGDLDYLIIDYPPGTGDIQLTLSQQGPLTAAVVCTTPQEVALADVRKAISMFETTEVAVLGVIETMSYFICDGCNKRHEIFRSGGGAMVAEAVGVPFLGDVPIDPRVAEGGDLGNPIVASHPDSPAAQAYLALASAVAGQLALLNLERGNYLESFSLKWDPN